MSAAILSSVPRGPAPLLNGRRLLFAAGIALLFGLANSVPDTAPAPHVTAAHAVVVGLMVVLAFSLLERYPRRLPDGEAKAGRRQRWPLTRWAAAGACQHSGQGRGRAESGYGPGYQQPPGAAAGLAGGRVCRASPLDARLVLTIRPVPRTDWHG